MKITAFGEIMLRLKAPGAERLLQGEHLETSFCGAELNVAVSLANYGVEVSFVTVLPDNDLGYACVGELRRWNVRTDGVRFSSGRMGLLFLESGADQRSSKVLYDRGGSALATAGVTLIDWGAELNGVDWLHITGITPALSESAAALTLAATRQAHEFGVSISCDLNYRRALWNYGIQAHQVMRELVTYTDLLIANEEDIQCSLNIQVSFSVDKGLETDNYRKLADSVFAEYPNLKMIAITLRESESADWNWWSACLFTPEKTCVSRKYEIRDIVDRVGSGDAFAGGLLYGLNHFSKLQDALEFATAASCLKHSIKGDFNRVSREEIERLMSGNGAGRIMR